MQLLDPAQGELEDSARLYCSLTGPDSARKITDGLFEALEQLSRFPLSGLPLREAELRSLGYRFIVVDKHVVICKLIGSTVFVYHIFDGRSDYPTLFKSELFRAD